MSSLAGRPPLASLTALTPGGGHVALSAGSLARRLWLLRLALRGTGLIDRRGGDALRRVFRPSALLQILLDVVVLAFALVAPGLLRHQSTSTDRPCKRRARYGANRAVSIARRSAMRSTAISG